MFDGSSSYSVSGGLHDVGLFVVNALSEALEVTIGVMVKKAHDKFNCHELPTDFKGRQGTRVRFWSSKEVFTRIRRTFFRWGTLPKPEFDEGAVTDIEFNYNTISERIRKLAFLNPEVGYDHAQGRGYRSRGACTMSTAMLEDYLNM